MSRQSWITLSCILALVSHPSLALAASACADLSGTYRMADHFEHGRLFGSYGSRCGGAPYVTIPNGTQVIPAGVIDPIGMAIDEDDVNAAGGAYSEYVTITQQGCRSLELRHWALLGNGSVKVSDLTLTPGTKHYQGTTTRVGWSRDGGKVTIHYGMRPSLSLYGILPGEHLDWTIQKSAQGVAYTYTGSDSTSKVDVSCFFEGVSP